MNVEQELEYWLISGISEKRANKHRDIKAVLYYYGFGNVASPTYTEIGQLLSIGTRERVRQVINANFRNSIKLDHLPVAKKIFALIQTFDCVPIPEVRDKIIKDGLGSENTNLRGLLNLAKDLNCCAGHDLYDSSLNKLSREEAQFDSRTYLVRNERVASLKEHLKRAKTLPGLLGLFNFKHLKFELNNTAEIGRIVDLIKNSKESNIIIVGNEEWYIFENRDNTLINSCEKVYSLSDQYRLPILAMTLENSLRRRTHKYSYPTAKVIAKWIEQSQWFIVKKQIAHFLGKKGKLTSIETDIASFLRGIEFSSYAGFRDHLLSLGYKKPSIDKAITTSPLITVDKSRQRTTYTYQLIVKAGAPLSRYQSLMSQLKDLLSLEKESKGESVHQSEQAIFREWLFDEQSEFDCAICGERYSSRALVPTHKKKRTLCSDSELIDPNIVFPLCSFGCDHLYREGIIYIVDGEVRLAKNSPNSLADSKRAQALLGKKINERWLQDSTSFFEANLGSELSI